MPRTTTSRSNAGLSTTAVIGQALRRYFVTGLATLAPLVITLGLLVWIFRAADQFLGRYFGFEVPGLGLIVTILLVIAVGIITIHFFGRVVIRVLEGWLYRLPIIRKIYPPIKQLAQFLFRDGEQPAAFQRVVLVEYPRPGSYSLAFVTNEATTSVTGRSVTFLTLLIPTPPSPFSGPILFVPKGDVIPLQLSVEAAITLVVSGGVAALPLQAAAAARAK